MHGEKDDIINSTSDTYICRRTTLFTYYYFTYTCEYRYMNEQTANNNNKSNEQTILRMKSKQLTLFHKYNIYVL